MSKNLFGKGGLFDNAFRSLDPVKHHPIYGDVKGSWFKSGDPKKVEAYKVVFGGEPVPEKTQKEYDEKMAAQSNPNSVAITEDEELAKALEMSLTTKEQGENANPIYITGNNNSTTTTELTPEEIQKKVEKMDAVIKANEALGVASQIASQEESSIGGSFSTPMPVLVSTPTTAKVTVSYDQGLADTLRSEGCTEDQIAEILGLTTNEISE